MSILSGEAELRERLMETSEEFRKLAREHQTYADELDRLSRRHHLSDKERMEQVTLKKKKLLLKDQMYSMVQRSRKAEC